MEETKPAILRPCQRLDRSISCPCNEKINIGWATASLLDTYAWNSSYSPLMDYSMPLPRSRFISVPHIRQLWSWDCGLACVSMVLKAIGVQDCDLRYLGDLCGTTSIWTVDLAHLLRQFSIDVAFLTITLGANPILAVESFYKDDMEEDGKRVNMLFEKAPHVGIQIQWRSISGEELAMLLLSGQYLVIALVDKRKLSHRWLGDLCLIECCGIDVGFTGKYLISGISDRVMKFSETSHFTGHYIVICGYDLDTDEFEIRDPDTSSASGKISLEALEEARKAFGTDEDLLLVSVNTSDFDMEGLRTLSLQHFGQSM